MTRAVIEQERLSRRKKWWWMWDNMELGNWGRGGGREGGNLAENNAPR